MNYLLALVLMLFSCNTLAAIYIQADSQGNVTYTDTPSNQGKPVILPQTENPISMPQEPEKTQAEGPTGPASNSGNASTPLGANHQNYTTFLIISPTDQQTFQNQRDIPVTLQINPPLQAGDRVQLYIDGIPSGDASSDLTQLAVHQVDRGEHQLNAALLDAANHVLAKTDNLTIFIHYSAIPTGSGALSPTSFGGNGVTPSSPGSGITPPATAGSGVTPPARNGSGVTPPPSPPAQPGAGTTPPAQLGGGQVPGK